MSEEKTEQSSVELHIDPGQADKLLKAGLISDETFKMISKKFAGGGAVLSPNSADMASVAPQVSSSQPAPSAGASPLDQILNQKITEAKTNTQDMAAQAPIEKSPTPYISDAEWATLEPSKKLLITDPGLAMRASSSGLIPSSMDNVLSKVGEISAKGGSQDLEKLRSAGIAQPGQEQAPNTVQLEKTQPGQAPQGGHPDMMQTMGNMYKSMAGNYDKAFGQMAGGITAEAQAGAKIAAAQAAAYTTATEQMQKFQDEQNTLHQIQHQKLDEQNQKVQSMVEDFTKNATIDPNRYWANESTGQKIMAGLGVFLGGLGRTPHNNDALTIIQNAINRDVDAQKAQVQNKATGVNMQNNVYKNMLDQFQDERSAEQATKLTMMNMLELSVKKMEAQNQGPMFAAKAQQALGQIGLQKAQLQGQLMQSLAFSPAMLAGNDQMRNVMMTFRNSPEMQKQAITELGEYQKHKQVIDGVKDSMDTMYNNRRNLVPGTQGYSQADAAKTNIKSLTTEIFGGKSEAEFKIIEGLLPKATDAEDTFNYKMDKIVKKLESQKSYPLLDGYNLRPKPLDLKRN